MPTTKFNARYIGVPVIEFVAGSAPEFNERDVRGSIIEFAIRSFNSRRDGRPRGSRRNSRIMGNTKLVT